MPATFSIDWYAKKYPEDFPGDLVARKKKYSRGSKKLSRTV